jgi:hypothetical protein
MKPNWRWLVVVYTGLVLVLILAGIASCAPVSSATETQMDSPPAAAPVAIEKGAGTVVLSADRVGRATVYQLLVTRPGYLPDACIMVQNDCMSCDGAFVAIDCD